MINSYSALVLSYLCINLCVKLTSSQFPFSLNIPSITKCTACKFNWKTLAHYGYSFDIDYQGPTIDLQNSELITFSSVAINYDSYNSTDISCNIHSGFIEAYNYQISIYYRESNSTSWTSKGTKSGHINREQTRIDRISLSDVNPPVLLTLGQWYIGLRLSWNVLSQQCDFIMDGWNISSIKPYSPNLVSIIPGTNHQITFKRITCLEGDLSINKNTVFDADILPHFDIEFELSTLSPTLSPTNNPSTDHPTDNPSLSPSNNPSINPTHSPSFHPTKTPTNIPTIEPTPNPSPNPTANPSYVPSFNPSKAPTFVTIVPTPSPSLTPTSSPTHGPTKYPSPEPTRKPSINPTQSTILPTVYPTVQPTIDPTTEPTLEPTTHPTKHPSVYPSYSPTQDPTLEPTLQPTMLPTHSPSVHPTNEPTMDPTNDPSSDPTIEPTSHPTVEPTSPPTVYPTSHPTVDPTSHPTIDPTLHPTTEPTAHPSMAPSSPPTKAPTRPPSIAPSVAPTTSPTAGPTPHCPAVFVTITDAQNAFDPDDFNGLYTFIHDKIMHDRPVWEVPQMATNKNIQYTGSHWIINGENDGVLSHASNSYYPPQSDTNAKWRHSNVSGLFNVDIKCVDTFSPMATPTMSPTQPPTISPTYSPTNAPSIISTHPTHIKMVFMWNISKNIQYEAIKNGKEDMKDAMIMVCDKYYNASLSITDVYVYGDGELSWIHLDIFALCELSTMDKCQILHTNGVRFRSLILSELIRLKSNIANIDANLVIHSLSETVEPISFYPDILSIAFAELSECGLVITFDFGYLSINKDIFDCRDIFIDKTLELFGEDHYCTWSTSTVLLVHLGFNHNIHFDVYEKHVMLYHDSVFIDIPLIPLQTKLVVPRVIRSPNVIVSGSRHIGVCDHLVLNIGSTQGNIGKSLYYEWNVYFKAQFLTQKQGFESQFVLSQTALQTFNVELLRIELHSKNWLDANNTNIIYVHYDNRHSIPSLFIESNNIQYHSFGEANIIVTPIANVRPSICNQNANHTDYLRYSWEQLYEFPSALLQQRSLPWPHQEYITQYEFKFHRDSKVLWIADTFEFYSSLNDSFVLPSVYFKLMITQLSVHGEHIASIHDYIAIQFVFDLPISYATHTLLHNVDNVFSLSFSDFFEFPHLFIFKDWLKNVYKFEWKCFVLDENEECSLNCSLFDDGCFDPTPNSIYQISLSARLYDIGNKYSLSIIYIRSITDSSIPHILWNKNIPQIISSSKRSHLSVSWNRNKISNITWLSSYINYRSYTNYHSNSSQIIINPYTISIHDVMDKYGCYIGRDKLNGGAQYELQMIAENEFLIAAVSISTSLGIRGEGCNITATDNVFIPMLTVFTVQCGEFTTTSFPLMYNFLLINNILPNDDGTWLNEQYMESSFFEFVLGAGNYSLRVIIQDGIGDVYCITITQNIIIHLPNNITQHQYIQQIHQYGMNRIHHAVAVRDHSGLIQNTLALSNTLCAFHYGESMDVIIHTLDIYLNLSHQMLNISCLNDAFRYKAIIAVYRQLLTNFHHFIFDDIVIMNRTRDIGRIISNVYELMQTLPYNVLQSYFKNKKNWDLTMMMSYDLYSDLLSIINIMRQNRNSLMFFIDMSISDHNIYVENINKMMKNIHLVFSNKFIVGEGIEWVANKNLLRVQLFRSETNAIHCGLTLLNTPSSMVNYINASTTDCVVLYYSFPQWISASKTPETISTSIQIDLYPIYQDTQLQTSIDTLQFDDECEDYIVFTLPIINNNGIDDSLWILEPNTSHNIPQCVYFERKTEIWSDTGCWLINYTLNETVCACNHFSSFALISDEFSPTLALLVEKDMKTFEWEMLLHDPICWLFVVGLILLFMLSLLCVPPINSIPLIARSNIILKAERDEMLPNSWIGGVIFVIRRRDKKCLGKLCSLYALNLRNQHSLLSICCGMEGMNISTTNILLTFMSYIVTLMILTGLYYAQILWYMSMNPILYSLCASVVSIIPLLLCRYLIIYAKPKTASSHYLTVQEKRMMMDEDHSVSFSSLGGAQHQKDDKAEDVTDYIVPGAEWKCNRCDRFNDSDYQFCGYCSHKRLSIVEEASLEPGSTQTLPTVPSMNAPLPMKKKHCYNISDSYDIESDSIVISDEDEGESNASDTDSNTATFNKYKKQQILDDQKKVTESALSTMKKPWSMSSASPTLSAVSHTTNTTLGTNIDTDLNTSFGTFNSKLRNRANKHLSNLSDFSDQHSQIGDIKSKIGILHGTLSPASPNNINHKKHHHHKLKHIRGISSMSSGLMNYNTENESLFMTDFETSIEQTPYASDNEEEEEPLPVLNETNTNNNYNRYTSISRRATAQIKEEEEEKRKETASLSELLLKVEYINNIRQSLIRTTYKFPHYTKYCVTGFMWIYILIGFGAIIYLGTHFNVILNATADDTELLSYSSKCLIPYRIQLNYKLSQQYIYSSFSEQYTLPNSTKWAISVVLGISFYIAIFLPIISLISTAFMMYSIHRKRTFDINYGFILFDVLCCCGKNCILKSKKYGKKTKKYKKDSKNKNAKFHGIPQNDDDLELKISEIEINLNDDDSRMKTPRRDRLHSFSGDKCKDESYSDDETYVMYKEKDDTEYSFLCNDKIFVHPTKAEEKRLKFMNCDGNCSPPKLLNFRPSSIQQKLALQNQDKTKKRKKKGKKKGKKSGKKRKRNNR